jgi:energy-coupling factor transporter transmembrane protein EcfT
MIVIYFICAIGLLSIALPLLMAYFIPHKINRDELLISVGSGILTTIMSIFVFFSSDYNYKLVHGTITDKEQETVSCSHSHTRCSGSRKSRRCTTYYEHLWDYDWVVKTTIGDITIDRVDRQGTSEPPRYTKAQIGDNVASTEYYTDYIGGSDSLYNTSKLIDTSNAYHKKVPNYPDISDYYNVNLVIPIGNIDKKIVTNLNNKLRTVMPELSKGKHNNTIIVITNESMSFAQYLKNAWNNGKINDGVIVIGVDKNNDITFTKVFGWSRNFMYFSKLETDLLDIQKLSVDTLDKIVYTIQQDTTQYFKEKSMKDFEYLMYEKEISLSYILFIITIQIVLNVGLAYYFYHNDFKFN